MHMTALLWLSSYVASHHLLAAPQSGAKDLFYSAAYYIALNPIFVAQRMSKLCGHKINRLVI
jgi:hypothetical protein